MQYKRFTVSCHRTWGASDNHTLWSSYTESTVESLKMLKTLTDSQARQAYNDCRSDLERFLSASNALRRRAGHNMG